MSLRATDMSHSGDSAATPARLRRTPSRLLAMAAGHSDRLVTAGLLEADARKWHYAVLAALCEAGPASQSALSDRTGIYRSDLVAVLNELADREMVQREPDPVDRRRNVITLTKRGRAQLDRLDVVVGALQDELLAPLSAPEREQLIDLLARLVEHHSPVG